MGFRSPLFTYSKSQRNGIYVLITLILIVQAFICCYQFNKADVVEDILEVNAVQKQIDSLRLLQKQYQPKYFNPNYLSDYKAYKLGMSISEIDRLFMFRKQGHFVNSVKEFQDVTQIHDTLLQKIGVYFKFPVWKDRGQNIKQKNRLKKIEIKDINTASLKSLMKVRGIGEKRAKTIINYRKLLSGYTFNKQLNEVWGIPPDVLERLKAEFKVLTVPRINKINVNNATFKELSSVVYIDFKQAKKILEYKAEMAEIQNLAELKNIANFPVDKFDLISIYLQAE